MVSVPILSVPAWGPCKLPLPKQMAVPPSSSFSSWPTRGATGMASLPPLPPGHPIQKRQGRASGPGPLYPGVAPRSPNQHLKEEGQMEPSLPWRSLAPEGPWRGETARRPLLARGWAGRRWWQRPCRLGDDIGAVEAAWRPGASGQTGRSMARGPGASQPCLGRHALCTVTHRQQPHSGKQSWRRGSHCLHLRLHIFLLLFFFFLSFCLF